MPSHFSRFSSPSGNLFAIQERKYLFSVAKNKAKVLLRLLHSVSHTVPINTITHCCFDDLTKYSDDSASEPLVFVLQIKYFIHK